MRRAARAVTQFYQVRMRKTGLRATQFTILNVLAYQEATIKQIADYLTIERSSVTRALAPLKRDGFVTGRRGEDARERILMLTGKGRKKLEEARTAWREAQKAFIEKLGEQRFRALLGDLREVVEQTWQQ